PGPEIVQQAVLPIVHEHAGGDVHGRHQGRAFLHPARAHDGRDLVRDSDELTALLGVEPEVVRMDLHNVNAGSALRSAGARTPARSLRSPAAAIIAALSVDSARLGRNVGISRCSPCICSSARSRLVAAPPPATPMLFAEYRRAASNTRSISTVTTTR